MSLSRNYRHTRIIETAELKAVVAELKDINRRKTTPELTRLQFNRAIKIIEKALSNAEAVTPIINEIKAEAKKEAQENIIKNKNRYLKAYKERKKLRRAM